MPTSSSTLTTAVVQNVNLKDDDVNTVYAIQVYIASNPNKQIIAYPFDSNIKRIPLIGETVVLVTSQGATAKPNDTNSNTTYYYLNPVSVQKNVHNNALPGSKKVTSSNKNSSYSEVSAGNPNSPSSATAKAELGKGFVERTDVGSLQPFIGDILMEGRFGHSIRLGYSPTKNDTSVNPTWESSTKEDPIMILSNGRLKPGKFNKFIIENVDDDKSSIWLTSSQKVKLTSSQKNIGAGVKVQGVFDKPTIILNSDRLFLNSKSDSIILSAKTTVNIATPSWAMDMDKLFTLIESLTQMVADLTSGTATFSTGVGPTGPATNTLDVQNILTDLKKMTQ